MNVFKLDPEYEVNENKYKVTVIFNYIIMIEIIESDAVTLKYCWNRLFPKAYDKKEAT